MARPNIDPWLVAINVGYRFPPCLQAWLQKIAEESKTQEKKVTQTEIIIESIVYAHPEMLDFCEDWIKTQEMRQAE